MLSDANKWMDGCISHKDGKYYITVMLCEVNAIWENDVCGKCNVETMACWCTSNV